MAFKALPKRESAVRVTGYLILNTFGAPSDTMTYRMFEPMLGERPVERVMR
ncbi:MAG: hypothetical protein N838_18655 [Thiohalocapsa sp. PB-PSB1]|nr:MAG: hypothetical protein N838_18655 [Thiohalocapsa sp. PB-PSB1]